MAYKYSQYGLFYTDKRRKKSRKFNITIVVLPTIGLILKEFAPYLSKMIPLQEDFGAVIMTVTSVLTVAVAAIKTLSPILNQPESELIELDEISKFYGHQFVKLMNLWNSYENSSQENEANDKDTSERLLSIIDESVDKSVEMNRIIRYISRNEDRKLESNAKFYIERTLHEKESTLSTGEDAK